MGGACFSQFLPNARCLSCCIYIGLQPQHEYSVRDHNGSAVHGIGLPTDIKDLSEVRNEGPNQKPDTKVRARVEVSVRVRVECVSTP